MARERRREAAGFAKAIEPRRTAGRDEKRIHEADTGRVEGEAGMVDPRRGGVGGGVPGVRGS